MKNRILKIVVYLAVYVTCVILFSRFAVIQRQQTVSASDLEDPTLPVMCVDVSGYKVNRMFGFVEEMDARNMRTSLIPMTTKRTITVSYKAYKNTVRSASYEVSAPDTGQIIENAKIGNFKSDGEYQTASFTLSEPILMNREYPIRFTLSTEKGDVNYYSRIIQRSDPVTDKYVSFVYDFYEGCTNQQGASDLNAYLETDDTITNTSYTSVNIQSSLRQVTWGNLKPQIYRKAVPTIKDISGETCTLTTDYLISAVGDAGTEVYHVWEYYRLRYYNSRMMLLNFNRKALQVFNGAAEGAVNTNGVVLGVAERNVDYISNETSDTVAFVQDGSLWMFNSGAEKLARVFSFHDVGSGSDERNDNYDNGIRLIRTSEGGGLDFIIYGHMCQGQHEGQMGVSICHYTAESSTVTERAFVPYYRSFEQLEKDLDKLAYVNTTGQAYLYLGRAVYRVDLTANSTDILLDNINPDCFASSASNASIAWMPEMKTDLSESATVMNLDTGSSRTIKADEGTFIRVLGFLNEDILYGLAAEGDIRRGISGDVTFAMRELKIEAFNGTLVKDYLHDGVYVTDVQMEPGLAQLTRVIKGKSGDYEPAQDDNIMNNRQLNTSAVQPAVFSNNRQGSTVTLRMPGAVRNLMPSVSDFRMRFANTRNASIVYPENDDFKLYYVYAGGRLQEIFTSPAQAVTLADEEVGVVVNQEGQYIYERGNKQTKTDLNNEDIPQVFLSGEIIAESLQMQAGDDVTVLNLSGCTLDQVLYQLSQGRACVTRLADGSTAVIVGYDRYNTLLYNFDTGEHYYMGINDSTNSMLEGGNVFVSYIEKQATVKEES